ncbi:MAG: hypothetical protein V4727_04100 [Verrucomicrobiota bacterium]
MAKPNQKSLELAELIRRSKAARIQIGHAHLQFKKKLDIPLRIRDSLKSSPLTWLGGSLGVGFLGSLLFRSKRPEIKHEPEKKHRGWFVGLLMMVFALAKPTLKIYATKLVKDYLQARLSARSGGLFGSDGRNPY